MNGNIFRCCLCVHWDVTHILLAFVGRLSVSRRDGSVSLQVELQIQNSGSKLDSPWLVYLYYIHDFMGFYIYQTFTWKYTFTKKKKKVRNTKDECYSVLTNLTPLSSPSPQMRLLTAYL